MTITIASVLFLTSSGFVAYEVLNFKQELVRHVSVLAEVIADSSAGAMAFQNAPEAGQVLTELKVEPNIVEAMLYDRDQHLVAQYHVPNTRNVPLGAPPIKGSYKFEKGSLFYYQPVRQAGGQLGTLVLCFSLHALHQRLALYACISFLAMCASLLIAYLLSATLQRSITQPILELAETAKAVSLRNDYSVRADKFSEDEVGLLTDAFNQMLDQIEKSREELRAAHQQISDHAQQLEKTVAERTETLQQTIGELESFSYSIAHDMRAPLRAMSRYAEVLSQEARTKLDSTERGHLERIVLGAQRLDHLIQDALSYSQISREKLQIQPVDLQQVFRSILEQYPEFGQSEADIELKQPLLNVQGHEASLTQCLSNLLANAVKFVAPGTRPQVTIWTQLVDSKVRVCVQDNGIGIAEQDQERIFGMFARVHSAEVYEGTGVGLAIVRKSVERMGGRVGVESKIGKGSVFWLELKRGES